MDEVSRTLHAGRFMLLVVGDGIRENVEGLLGALHRQPQLLFTFAMVEVQIYDLPGAGAGRLVIPQLIANTVEVVRAVVKVHAPDGPRVTVELEEVDAPVDRPGGGRRTLSEDEFFREVRDHDTARTCRQLLALADDIGAAKGWRASSVSVQFPDPRGSKQKVTLFVMQTDGEIYTGWAMQQLETLGLDPKLAADYARSVAGLFRDVTPNPRQPDSLSRRLSAAEVDQAMVPFTAAVKGFVKGIEEASKG